MPSIFLIRMFFSGLLVNTFGTSKWWNRMRLLIPTVPETPQARELSFLGSENQTAQSRVQDPS